jgi:two-component system chemotaxis sensor kinase CheA
MERHNFTASLMETYLDELRDHTATIGAELLSLEKAPSKNQLAESWAIIFRCAHTLKGASAMVHVEPVREVCHHLEDIFGFYRDQQQAMPETMTTTVLKVIDAIEETGNRLRNEADLDDTPLLTLLPEVERLASMVHDSSAAENEVNSDAEPAVQPIAESEPAPKQAVSIADQLIPTFLAELDEHVATLSKSILALESESDAEQRKELFKVTFRAAHSLKGASGAVKVFAVQKVCHHLETVLSGLRDSNSKPNADVVSRVLETCDAISDAGERIRRNESLESALISKMAEKLDLLTAKSKEIASKEPAPAATVREKSVSHPFAKAPSAAGSTKVSGKEIDADAAADVSDPIHKEKTSPKSKQKTPNPKRSEAVDSGASIRVPAQKLDALLAHSGELLVARGRLAMRAKDAGSLRDLATQVRTIWANTQKAIHPLTDGTATETELRKAGSLIQATSEMVATIAKRMDRLSTEIETDNRLLGQTCGLLDDEIYHVRMLPFADACGGLQRAVRDIAKSTNKQVTLVIEGADVEVDRSVLEGLKDPLLHLVRNAVDHGIENPQQRVAAGKAESATITVSASLRGRQVEVKVQDDGAGFDLPRICQLAAKRGLEVPDDPYQQARLVFVPGFSTAKMITDISGRGVGLDVVQSQVESLRGEVDVSFVKGEGTKFSLLVPLTLTTIRATLVRVNDQIVAIPTASIQHLTRFAASDIRSTLGRDVLSLRGAQASLVSLAMTLGMKSGGLIPPTSSKGLAVVLVAGEQRVALAVDEVIAEQEILVKNLGARIRRLRHFSGCTLLPSGKIALVVSTANLVRSALGIQIGRKLQATLPTQQAPAKRLLLADDSMTTRELLKIILETAGYHVVATADGQEAWEATREHQFDVVVTDVDMPRLDGFELTERLRADDTTAELPIVLVTARGSDEDKERGVRSGANAYIVKGSFDQQSLLNTLTQLV